MRSTVMSESPQPLQATVNSRLDASRMDHLFGGVRVPEVPAQVADVARRRNPECLRGGADGELLADDDPKLVFVHAETRTTEPLPLGASATKTGADPFHDQASRQPGAGRNDGEPRLTRWRPRVDRLAQSQPFPVQR